MASVVVVWRLSIACQICMCSLGDIIATCFTEKLAGACKDVLPAEMGLPAEYLSFFRIWLSACLQRAQAHALNQVAGRALVGGRRDWNLPSECYID
eukprot:SM000016S01906  [mRNA]  locus=s16:449679:451546:- [translate_table: standard]